MKTYELPDLLAVVNSEVNRNTRSLSFDEGAYFLHDTGVWLWLDEDKNLTDTERKVIFESLGFPDITTNRQSVDGRTVWGIGPTTPLMPIPFTLEQLRKFDKVSCDAITDSLSYDVDADFDVEKIGLNASEVGRFLLFREMPLDQAEPAKAVVTPAPVVTEQAGVIEDATYPKIKKEGYLLKRSALVKKYLPIWPGIESDLNHASENGLSEAAKGTKYGDWFESSALAWAEQKGRLSTQQTAWLTNSIFNLPGTVHTND